MKRKIPLFRILVASAVLFSAASVFAEPPGPPPEEGGMFGPGNPREFGKLMDELKLTDAQRAKVKAQHEATKTDAKKYHEQLKPMHEELRALLEANTVDLKAVRLLKSLVKGLDVRDFGFLTLLFLINTRKRWFIIARVLFPMAFTMMLICLVSMSLIHILHQ